MFLECRHGLYTRVWSRIRDQVWLDWVSLIFGSNRIFSYLWTCLTFPTVLDQNQLIFLCICFLCNPYGFTPNVRAKSPRLILFRFFKRVLFLAAIIWNRRHPTELLFLMTENWQNHSLGHMLNKSRLIFIKQRHCLDMVPCCQEF